MIDHIVSTPTGLRVLTEMNCNFAVLHSGYAPGLHNDATKRLHISSAFPDGVRYRPDGIFILPRQAWTMLSMEIEKGKSRHVEEIEKCLFYMPVRLWECFKILKASGQMVERWNTFDPVTGLIYSKTVRERAAYA